MSGVVNPYAGFEILEVLAFLKSEESRDDIGEN
jgi:hypothetical protein